MKENNEKEVIIECVCRRYRVQMPGGLLTEVESTKPLSVQMTHELLEEDNEIDSFFAHHKIMSIRQVIPPPSKIAQDSKHSEKPTFSRGVLSPLQRLNHLLKMKGEFTREEYQGYMLDTHRFKITKSVAYDDLQAAAASKRLEKVKKVGRFQKYKVVDPVEIDENLYRQIIMKDHKIHMGIVQ